MGPNFSLLVIIGLLVKPNLNNKSQPDDDMGEVEQMINPYRQQLEAQVELAIGDHGGDAAYPDGLKG